MEMAAWRQKLPKIGLRKVKSVIAVAIAFAVWQIIRWIVPSDLEVHPLFGYVYAVVELRETPEKTKMFSFYRIKATLVGLALGLLMLPLSVYLDSCIQNGFLVSLADLGLILVGVLVSLWIAELLKCKNLCGIAAIVYVICITRDRNTDVSIYLYAILRTSQTLVGIFAAWFANTFFFKRRGKSASTQ